ncbi:MAG: protein-glutamate O-methyltransferase [Woeseiaceae bacterium]
MVGNVAQARETEFHFSDKEFKFISKLVGERTGIVLSDAKRQMVYGRLSRRLRQLNLTQFSDYCDLLTSGHEGELIEFTNAITTNLTAFFRENHHFEYLKEKVLPELMKNNRSSKRIRIWSAGCSSGEEPYSIAMCVREMMPRNSDWDVKILATDLDSNMVQRGKNGIYTAERVEGLTPQRMKKWVQQGKGENADKVKMSDSLRELITFKELNLMEDWPIKGPFDLMFCRNVVIYFNKDTQRILFDRYANLLVDDAHLFIGHSESLTKVSDRFNLLGHTIYQKAR